MRFVRLTGLGLAIAVTLAAAPAARAFEELTPTPALGMGGASRAWAVGDAGPLLNPSGMTLLKTYTLEGLYSYASRLSDQYLHASIVDNTSSYNLAGGLYYTYHTSSGALAGQGHEAGLSLAFPFGNYLAIGGTLKYLTLSGGDVVNGHDGGITFDVGLTARPTGILSIGVVGANLRPLDNSQATQSVGYGVAVLPIPALLLTADGLTRLTPDNATGRKGTSVMGGATYTIYDKVALRAGGGYDGVTQNGYGTLGMSAISDIGALDAGVRQDLLHGAGVPRETVVNISLRLFIPASQTNQDPSSFINSQ
ncbi:MAG TPA: hypothetical protein VMT03_17835 [Polyangia bacterium]|nr:hypothetical protein [Polyangia bacterium]